MKTLFISLLSLLLCTCIFVACGVATGEEPTEPQATATGEEPTESQAAATEVNDPNETESEKKDEHIDENQGEWDTEDTPIISTEASASDTQNSEELTADHETHHDENEGEWDVE